MALQSSTVSLRGHFSDGRNVSSEAFILPLRIGTGEAVEAIADRGQWQSALVILSKRRIEDFEKEDDPHDHLTAAIHLDLERIGGWLGSRRDVVSALRSIGLEVDVFVDLWIDQDQLDWSFPPIFLLACGEVGLSVRLVSND